VRIVAAICKALLITSECVSWLICSRVSLARSRIRGEATELCGTSAVRTPVLYTRIATWENGKSNNNSSCNSAGGIKKTEESINTGWMNRNHATLFSLSKSVKRRWGLG